MSKQELQSPIDEVTSRLSVVEQQKADERIEKLDCQFRELSNKLSELKGLMSAVGLVFLLITALGLWRIYKNDEIDAHRAEFNELLIKQVQAQTADTIDKLTVTEVSQEQSRRIVELGDNVQRLVNIDVGGKRFEGIRELVEALKYLNQRQNRSTEALNIVESLSSKYPDDPFINSRALTLRALILISFRKTSPPVDLKDDLENAIRLDSTNAGAFNALGISIAGEAVSKVQKGEFALANSLMKEALIDFKMAASLDPSSIGTYKYVNNKTVCNLLLFRAFMMKDGFESSHIPDLLRTLNYKDADEFFAESRQELETYKGIAPTFPAALETIAQSRFLEAEYKRYKNKGQDKDADNLEKEGVETFVEAIDKGLYRRVRTEGEAVEQFNTDYLHKYFIKQNPELAQSLRDRIMERFPKDTH
jgi:hypothetical protein